MPPSRLPGIAADFTQLSQRFEDYLGRAVKPTHLLVNVEQSAVRAGRLLQEAADLGAFQGDSWWRDGKSPAHPFDDGEGSSIRYESDAEFSRSLWTFAIGSWLVVRWPSRFRHKAGGWDWACVETDEDGRLLDKDGNPLQVRSRGSKEGLPEDSQRPDEGLPAQDTSPLEGKIAMKHDFYDESDAFAHLRIRAEAYSDACLLLAELSLASPTTTPRPTGLGEADPKPNMPDKPDADGYVETPKDPSAYAPLTTVVNSHTPDEHMTVKQASKIADDFASNRVRWTRPKTNSGNPNPKRRNIHLGDWAAYLKSRTGTECDGFQDPTGREIQNQTAAIRRANRPR